MYVKNYRDEQRKIVGFLMASKKKEQLLVEIPLSFVSLVSPGFSTPFSLGLSFTPFASSFLFFAEIKKRNITNLQESNIIYKGMIRNEMSNELRSSEYQIQL